jgi:RNA polymerase II subunit A small phosphatase-like protein
MAIEGLEGQEFDDSGKLEFDPCSELLEDLTDESNACEDDHMQLIIADGVVAEPSLDDEFELVDDFCLPVVELHLCEVSTLPPQAEEWSGKMTVIFDLDETLVHARDGTIRPRPHLADLLKVVQDRCEPLIWTASMKSYAERVVNAIDPDRVFRHCVCRTDTWYVPPTGPFGHAKDLRLLRRDLDRTIIIENTPDCVVKNPLHSIIVPDYVRDDPSDRVLVTIAAVLDGLLASQLPVPEYLAACPLLRLETLRNPSGDTLTVFMVKG